MLGRYRPAIFILTYALTKKGIEYLILKRKLHWTGWEFPKGGIDGNDGKSLIHTLNRELNEETGLKALKIKKFNFSGKYKYDKEYPDRRGLIGQTYKLFSVEVKKSKRIKLDKIEHAGFRWVNFKEAKDKLTWNNQKRALKIVNNFLNKNQQAYNSRKL